MILFFENASSSPAWPLVPRYLSEIQNSGLGDEPELGPAWNDAVLCFMAITGDCYGFLAYRHDEPCASWWITCAYVQPAFRRQKIHTLLFEALVKRAQEKDILSIRSATNVSNEASNAAMLKQGRIHVANMYTYKIAHHLGGELISENQF